MQEALSAELAARCTIDGRDSPGVRRGGSSTSLRALFVQMALRRRTVGSIVGGLLVSIKNSADKAGAAGAPRAISRRMYLRSGLNGGKRIAAPDRGGRYVCRDVPGSKRTAAGFTVRGLSGGAHYEPRAASGLHCERGRNRDRGDPDASGDCAATRHGVVVAPVLRVAPVAARSDGIQHSESWLARKPGGEMVPGSGANT